MFSGVVSSSQKQKPAGSRHIICPTCLHVTEHEVVEETVWLTLFGIRLLVLSRRAIFRCPECGDMHSLDWAEYEGQVAQGGAAHEAIHEHGQSAGPGSTTRVAVKNRPRRKSASPVDPAERNIRRFVIGGLVLMLVIAATVLIPIINIVMR